MKTNTFHHQTSAPCHANIRKRVLWIVLLCIITSLLTGCGGPSLKGTWKATDSDMQEASLCFTDGTMTLSAYGLTISGEYEAKDGQLTYTLSNPITGQPETVTQAYTIENDVLTMGGINYTRAK